MILKKKNEPYKGRYYDFYCKYGGNDTFMGDISSMRVQFLGTCSRANVITRIYPDIIFLGSQISDSYLLRMHYFPIYEREDFEPVEYSPYCQMLKEDETVSKEMNMYDVNKYVEDIWNKNKNVMVPIMNNNSRNIPHMENMKSMNNIYNVNNINNIFNFPADLNNLYNNHYKNKEMHGLGKYCMNYNKTYFCTYPYNDNNIGRNKYHRDKNDYYTSIINTSQGDVNYSPNTNYIYDYNEGNKKKTK